MNDKMSFTHNMYVKVFHKLLATKQIELKPVDLLLYDEFQDCNEVFIEIYKLYPA